MISCFLDILGNWRHTGLLAGNKMSRKPQHNPALNVYQVLDLKIMIRDKLISKGLLFQDANQVVEQTSITISPDILGNCEMREMLLEEYASTIIRLYKYISENNLPSAMFFDMAHGVALSIGKLT